MSRFKLVVAITLCFGLTAAAVGQVGLSGEATVLRANDAVERSISSGESHDFTVNLEQNQFLQLVVEQKGVDVTVQVFSPDGQNLVSSDSPNGAEGPEGVSIVARAPGNYRINVTPPAGGGGAPAGRYEIKITDLRAATKGELGAADPQNVKEQGTALLKETVQSLPQIRQIENRVRLQLQAARLMSNTDPEMAKSVLSEAVEGVKAFLGSLDLDDQNYYQNYQVGHMLRSEVLTALGASDPGLALAFLRATRNVVNSDEMASHNEEQLEMTLAAQVAARDPRRALQIAEESLGKGYPHQLIETIHRLQEKDPKTADELTGKIVDKLRREDLLRNHQAHGMVFNLAQMRSGADSANKNDQALRELISKMLADSLAVTPAKSGVNTPERTNAQNILNFFRSNSALLEKYAPGQAAAIDKKVSQLDPPQGQENTHWRKFTEAMNSNSLDQTLAAAAQAPAQMRDQFYQQAAWKASAAGEYERAKQIINEHVSNPFQRRQAIKNLEQQSILGAAGRGNFDEALRLVNNLRTPKERAAMLLQLINQGGRAQKRETVLNVLEQARGMLGSGARAEDQEHMNTLIAIVQAYARLEPQRAVEVLEPLVDQFNEMCAAALTLNNFPQPFYRDGELMLMNGNNLGMIANQLIHTCGLFARVDFERAKAIADRVQRPEVRFAIQLAIAQNVIMPTPAPGSMNQVAVQYDGG